MNLRMRICLLCLAGFFTGPVWADPIFDQKVDELFTEWANPELPGAAIGIIQDGDMVYAKGFGSANIETDTPITPQSVFYLGSVGKQFTTMAIALLQQDGKLEVDDDIRKYIPEFPDYGSTITIRHLIHHTSGIRDYLGLMRISGLPYGFFHNDQDIVDILASQKALNFVPGDQYLYSNSGYFLLAVIVKRVSGKSLREFAAERMFAPLDMQNSHFHDEYTHPIKQRAMSYTTGEDGELDVFISTFDRVGSGGVYSNVDDLLKWDRNFYSHQVGGQQVYDWLLQKGKLNDGTEIDYAWGIDVSKYRGLNVVQHGGALGGYRTTITRFPDNNLTVIILANLGSFNPGGLAMQVAEIYLGELMQALDVQIAEAGKDSVAHEVVEVTEASLKSVTGLYYNNDMAMARKILIIDGRLVYSRGDSADARTELRTLGDDRFMMVGVPLSVSFDRSANQMIVSSTSPPPTVFNRVDRESLENIRLEGFSGRYHSMELDLTVELEATEEGLALHHPRYRDDPSIYELASADLLVNLQLGALQFSRDDNGSPIGFSLDTVRVKGIYFERVAGQ